MNRNKQSSEEICFSPIVPKQKMNKKEERAEKIKVSQTFKQNDHLSYGGEDPNIFAIISFEMTVHYLDN